MNKFHIVNEFKASNTEELEGHFEEVLSLLHRITRYYKELEYLRKERSSEDRNEYAGKYELFQYVEDALLFVMVMDLAILYKQGEHYSLHALFEKAKVNFDFISKEHGLTLEHLDNWINDLKQTNIKKALSKVIKVRNEHFAHLDRERKDIQSLMPTMEELKDLIDAAVGVVIDYYFFTTGISLFIKPIYEQSGSESIIDTLRDLKK